MTTTIDNQDRISPHFRSPIQRGIVKTHPGSVTFFCLFHFDFLFKAHISSFPVSTFALLSCSPFRSFHSNSLFGSRREHNFLVQSRTQEQWSRNSHRFDLKSNPGQIYLSAQKIGECVLSKDTETISWDILHEFENKFSSECTDHKDMAIVVITDGVRVIRRNSSKNTRLRCPVAMCLSG